MAVLNVLEESKHCKVPSPWYFLVTTSSMQSYHGASHQEMQEMEKKNRLPSHWILSLHSFLDFSIICLKTESLPRLYICWTALASFYIFSLVIWSCSAWKPPTSSQLFLFLVATLVHSNCYLSMHSCAGSLFICSQQFLSSLQLFAWTSCRCLKISRYPKCCFKMWKQRG